MKRTILLIVFSLIVSVCNGQEWFTSFDVAKRLAIVQNKMLFVLWEESFQNTVPLLIESDNGKVSVIDLSKDNRLDPIIWEYFVPVRISESKYEEFIGKARGRGFKYLHKLADNSIKIMDVNGNILNVNSTAEVITDFSLLIDKYALNTSFLNQQLKNYSNERTFISSYLLAEKYIDYSVFADDWLRPELLALANIYLNESRKILSETYSDKNDALFQKIEMIEIEELLILNHVQKAHRRLKRIDENEVDAINQRLFGFLKYTVFKLLKDRMKADLWKSKISSLDLKKAELIIKNNLNGRSY